MKMTIKVEAEQKDMPALLRMVAAAGFQAPVVIEVGEKIVEDLPNLGRIFGDFTRSFRSILDKPTITKAPEKAQVGSKFRVPGRYETYVESSNRALRGMKYLVIHHQDGEYSCTCPAWKNNVTRPCKHILKARMNDYQKWEGPIVKNESMVLASGPVWERVVKSSSIPGRFYVVKGTGQTAISCDCPDHIHRAHRCKHMMAVEAELARK